MSKKIKIVSFLFAVSTILILSSSCIKNRTGVCYGYSNDYSSTYCYDDWTQEECDEWFNNFEDVNVWFFHRGQTCADRELK